MKQIEVQIMGQSYMLTCPEHSEVRLREAVARVDAAMCTIRDSGKVKARDRIAVLAALNVTFELLAFLPPGAMATSPAQAPAPLAPLPGQHPPSPPEASGAATPNPQLDKLLQRLNAALDNDGRPA